MSQFMHTVRFFIGMAMLAAGVTLAQPFAAAVLTARGNAMPSSGPATADSTSGRQSGLPAIMIGAGGHAIPDARPAELPTGAGVPLAKGGHVPPSPPPSPPTPLPASGKDQSPASPALDGTYRSTVDIPPPPLLDVHAPPPLSAGWSVHDVAKPAVASQPAVASPALQPAPVSVDYVVRDGDDLTGIALKVYGHAGAATAIWTANRDRLADPQVLPIGLALRMPPSWMLPAAHAAQGSGASFAIEPTLPAAQKSNQSKGAVSGEPGGPAVRSGEQPFWLQEAPAPAASPSLSLAANPGQRPVPGPIPAHAAPAQRPAMVRVGMGDSLESIAVRFYGDRTMAPRIWLANQDRLRSPDLLVPGVELRLP